MSEIEQSFTVRRGPRVVAIMGAVVLTLIGFAMASLSASMVASAAGRVPGFALVAVGAAVAAGSLWMAIWIFRLVIGNPVVAGDTELRWMTAVGTRHLPWSDIATVSVRAGQDITLRTRTGRTARFAAGALTISVDELVDLIIRRSGATRA